MDEKFSWKLFPQQTFFKAKSETVLPHAEKPQPIDKIMRDTLTQALTMQQPDTDTAWS